MWLQQAHKYNRLTIHVTTVNNQMLTIIIVIHKWLNFGTILNTLKRLAVFFYMYVILAVVSTFDTEILLSVYI